MMLSEVERERGFLKEKLLSRDFLPSLPFLLTFFLARHDI